MKVLLLWNRDREDGWLLGDLSFVVNDLTSDYEAACKEIAEKVPNSYFEEFFKDEIFEEMEAQHYPEEQQENHTFKFDNVNYIGYTFNFVFKDQEGEEISLTKECDAFIEPYSE